MRKIYMVVTMLLVFSPAYAQSVGEEIKAGITPDNPLWILDKLEEKLELALTFDKAKKVEKRIEFAEERLAEAEEMVTEGKAEHAVKAIEEQEKLIIEAQEEVTKAGDVSGLNKAIRVIEEHKERIEERKDEVLSKLPEDSPARERIEKRFDMIEERADEAIERLEEVKAKKSERVKEALAIVAEATGIDAEAEYERLMTEGKVSKDAILKAIDYVNRQIVDSNISLESIEGDVIKINIVREDVVTQSIVVAVYKNRLKYVTAPTTVDYTIKVEVDDIPEAIEKAQEGDTKWLLAKLGKACGTDCVGIAKNVITSVKKTVEMGQLDEGVEYTYKNEEESNDEGRDIVSKITGGRIGR